MAKKTDKKGTKNTPHKIDIKKHKRSDPGKNQKGTGPRTKK